LPIVCFNLGQLVLSTGLSASCYVWLGGRVLQNSSGGFSPWAGADFPTVVIPLVAVAVLCVSGNLLLMVVAVTLHSRETLNAAASSMVAIVPAQFTLAGVGFLVAQVLAISAWALPLFIAPLVLARQLYFRYAALKTAYADTIRSLVGAMEAKDPYTRGHSERVSKYAVALGEAAGLDSRALERLEYAALLHDIGKLAVPSAVLTKPGTLDLDETQEIRRHPERGSEMIARIPPLRDLVNAVAQHHERVDGNGYPGRVRGLELSSVARILSVADSFDAMTSTRSYRSALDTDEAIAELIRGANTQFDEEIVRLFVQSCVRRPVGDSSAGPLGC